MVPFEINPYKLMGCMLASSGPIKGNSFEPSFLGKGIPLTLWKAGMPLDFLFKRENWSPLPKLKDYGIDEIW